INAIIRNSAADISGGAQLVDAADVMARGEDAAGARYFFEHVHFTWEGNVRLSHEITTALLRSQATAKMSPTDPPVMELAAALGFTDYGRLTMLMAMDELTARPPFTQQTTYAADRTRLVV